MKYELITTMMVIAFAGSFVGYFLGFREGYKFGEKHVYDLYTQVVRKAKRAKEAI